VRLPYGEQMARLAYLGTPEMAAAPLRALVGAGHEIVLCVTRPDRRRGRGGAVSPSPVKEVALELGLPVSHSMGDVAAAGAELGVVVAYGRIIPVSLLEEVPMVNLHFSLLPRWRGAAPVERAILAGDAETGVCVMAVEEGLDTGGVYARRAVPLRPDTYLSALRNQLAEVGSELLLDVVADGRAGLPEPVPQAGPPTTADKVTPDDLRLAWEQPAAQLGRVVRLERAWTTFRGRRLRVLRASADPDAVAGTAGAPPGVLVGTSVTTGEGTLHLEEVQPESRAPMPADAWVRGVHPTVGERLGRDVP
jgi:methionyl-tRNA formyltransferase